MTSMTHAIAVPRSRVAYKFFVFAGAVLAVQFIVGLAAAAQYAWPQFLADTMPFNMWRMLHINGLVVSLLAGFMGATYFLLAEESGGELASERAANVRDVDGVVRISTDRARDGEAVGGRLRLEPWSGAVVG